MKASYQGITLEGNADEVVSAITKLMKAMETGSPMLPTINIKPSGTYYMYPWWGIYPPTTTCGTTDTTGYVKYSTNGGMINTSMNSYYNSSKPYLTPVTYTQAE